MAEIIHGMTYAEYDALPGIRASHLKAGLVSMLHMRHAVGTPAEETPAMRWGRLIHFAVLEPDRFRQDTAIWTGGRRYGKKWDEFCTEHDPAHIVTADEATALVQISAALHGHPIAGPMIRGSQHEVVVTWHDDSYGAAKSRIDAVHVSKGIIEYKTVGQIEPRLFESSAYRLGYHIQFAWQRLAIQMATGDIRDVHVVTQEQKPPYDVVVYRVDEEVLEHGEAEALRVARRWRECCERGEWPGVSSEIETLLLPPWAGQEARETLVIGGEEVRI